MAGVRVTIRMLPPLQFNPDRWALVYHGLLYSVGECAEINDLARRELFFA